MYKLFASFFILLLLAAPPGGCARAGAPAVGQEDGSLRIVCTIFPLYDWVREILGDAADGVELTLLLDNRIDLHNFQPSVDDMIRVSTCDLFVYVGGESDHWADDALKEAVNRDMIVLHLLDELGEAAKVEEIIEGMEAEDEDGDDEDEDDYDEHVWLSLPNAKAFCIAIADALSKLDPARAGVYEDNLDAYTAKLSALDAEYRAAVGAAAEDTLLFGDRFPFRYLLDDYGLDYFAAFPGCSAETEASFDTIIFLARKMDELDLRNVMVTESADQSIARTIIGNTTKKDQQILVLDAMQSVTSSAVQAGLSYLSVMQNNLEILKEALHGPTDL